jgi:hypothetical protein
MAGIKQRGVSSIHIPKTYKGQLVKPSRYIGSNGGSGYMTGTVIETGDLVWEAGKSRPTPWRNIS